MIKNTFLHFKNINARTEKKLWQQGLFTWEDYVNKKPFQLGLLEGMGYAREVQNALDAFYAHDVSYFAERLHPHEFYRLALAFPEDVLFLDIETTGLSVYYDIITMVGWSQGSNYGAYINGTDPSDLNEIINKAKIIVTFNGTLFDLKFIKKSFPTIKIPYHIDLRFFAKRVGMTGGQKNIEESIGFKRNKKINTIRGEEAPILWHKYRHGDMDSLKGLIEYNHADIEGMKCILDKCIELHYKKDEIPFDVQSKFKFADLSSKILWSNNLKQSSSTHIYLHPYQGEIKPSITYSDLNRILPLDDFCVAGIDLVASENKESGFCLLYGNHAQTFRIKSDDDMIDLIRRSQAKLVSIDSPLSLPSGRSTVWDDDPMRAQYGITRECERTLKKRGISSYPCLIPSMQGLTLRGMGLARKLREHGIPVIESYPGAAQDIMKIPRKQAGLPYLTEGLRDFGITGDFLRVQVSHDELDAITSAIVGLFFWTGKFEPLGNADEDYLIIPSLEADNHKWLERIVVGFSGTIGSGKTTSAKFFESKGFTVTRFSKILQQILREHNEPASRTNLQNLGLKIHKSGKQRWLGKEVIRPVFPKQKVIVDGLRFPEDHATLVEAFGPRFKHMHIKCYQEIKTLRRAQRGGDQSTLLKAMSHEVEKGISQLTVLAHHQIQNDASKEELFEKIENIIGL